MKPLGDYALFVILYCQLLLSIDMAMIGFA